MFIVPTNRASVSIYILYLDDSYYSGTLAFNITSATFGIDLEIHFVELRFLENGLIIFRSKIELLIVNFYISKIITKVPLFAIYSATLTYY